MADDEFLKSKEARTFLHTLLQKHGYPEHSAAIMADHLVTAELRGYPSHGFWRVPQIVRRAQAASQASGTTVALSKPGFTLFDGGGQIGLVAVHEALERAAETLKTDAATVFGLTNFVGTTGSIGIYASGLADRGIVSILMCHSRAAVAPQGSAKAVLGTNPIAIGFPGQPVSFCADVSTAAMSYGKIMAAARAGETLPQGIVQTKEGQSSTDPNDADAGSQLPMAGHKGYALGLAIELLCGPLLGGKAGTSVKGSDGFFGILIRADCARSIEAVTQDTAALFAEIKSGLATGTIRIPGEGSARLEREATHIEVPVELMERLRALM